MKILLISEFFPTSFGGKMSGGTEARSYYVGLELIKLKHEVIVLTSRLPNSLDCELWNGMKVIRVGEERTYTTKASLKERMFFVLSVVKEGMKHDFEIVDGNTLPCYIAAFLLGIFKKAKSVFWIPDLPGFVGWSKSLGWINGLIATMVEYLSVLLPASGIIALSDITYQKIKNYGVSDQKIMRIYPGFVKTKIKGKIRDIKNKKKLTLISIQRLVNYKRTDLVIKSLKKIDNKISYIVIGEGLEMNNIKNLISNMSLSKRVILKGNMPHHKVFEIADKADIFTLPSEVEGFGYVTLEAMSLGIPFVNSDIPVHKEIYQASKAGILFKTGDENDFCAKISDLINKPDLYNKLSRNALIFSEKLTWSVCAKHTAYYYSSLLQLG